MLLVHLSDLHCGGDTFSPKILEKAIREVNHLRPDVIVITGDITNSGLIDEYKLASRYIKKFKCEKVLVGSGNHDYQHTGFLLWGHFFPPPEKMILEKVMISHLRTARPDRSTGEVGHRQLLWFDEVLRRHKKKVKVVAMHHHLVPIPDTGTGQNIVVDAGNALRTMIEGRVNLVLCGHKHRPWKSAVNGLPIVHAGSVSSRRLRGFFANSYNIIEIGRDAIDVKLKVVGGNEINFKKILSGYNALPPKRAK